jgi:hypothetical protein
MFGAVYSSGIPRISRNWHRWQAFSELVGSPDSTCGMLPAFQTVRTALEGLIWPYSLAFGHTAPVGSS